MLSVNMNNVSIVTDSSACIPASLAAAQGIEIVPFTMAFGNEVFRDGLDDAEDFYEQLRLNRSLPKTSAPSPGAFLSAFHAAAKRGTSVLAITLPANLSSAHNACQQAVGMARDELPGTEVRCLEAGAVAAGQGLIVLEAARSAALGATLAEAATLTQGLGSRVHFFAFLDTLEYLAKGGHVPKVAAWIGDLVGLRPVLTAPHGDVRRITQARSRRGATARVVRLVAETNPSGRPIKAMVMHAGVLREAEELSRTIEARFECAEMHVTQFTPVMGSHSGPGVLGVAILVMG